MKKEEKGVNGMRNKGEMKETKEKRSLTIFSAGATTRLGIELGMSKNRRGK